MTAPDHPTLTLVLGGTGKTGRRVVDRLRDRGLAVRVGSRAAEPPFDWDDRSTWTPALHGVDAMYLSYFPDLAAPGATANVAAFLADAAHAGVRRLVLLSGRGEDEAQACERLVRASGFDWTILRASWFDQNFSEGHLLESILAGRVAVPVGDVPEPFVDAEDIAEVALAALTGGGHRGQLYELTGPRMLTFAEAIGEIAKALDRDLEFVTVGVEDHATALAAEGLGPEEIDLITYLFTTVLDGRNSWLGDGVERALGRAPRDFYDFAWDAARAGVWDRR